MKVESELASHIINLRYLACDVANFSSFAAYLVSIAIKELEDINQQ